MATQYDANGRVAQSSRPYFLSGGAPKFTVPTYDTIGRVIKTTYPDASKTTFGFDGLTTTVTNDKSQVTTTLKNAQGLNASVTDANSKTVNYVYDAFGDLLTVTDPSGHTTTNTYDIRGRKIIAEDPDMGTWFYLYDGFGELYSQTDAKSQVTSLTYDALGRTLSRTEPGLTSTWTYDTATHGVGQLASVTTGSTYTRALTYDTLSRPSSVTLTLDGNSATYTTVYNSDGRISTVTYPSGFTALYGYTALGYQYQVSDFGGTHQVFWTANTRDAELHLLTQTAGNAIVTTDSFDPNTGRPVSILAGTSNSVSNQTFAFDTLGNLTTRTWLNNAGASVKENACYDVLNRLTSTLVTTGTGCTGAGAVAIAYDALGNITEKSDVCSAANCMAYGAGAGPHALTSITGTYNGVTNPTFAYDADGNMTSGGGRTITSTSFNMAASIVDGANSAALSYDSEHARYKQVAVGANAGTTYYRNDPISGMMEEEFIAGATTTWRDYLMADGKMVGERSCIGAAPCTGTVTLQYFTLDHLGSIAVITNATGAIVERDSYDAWGKRRNADGTAANCGTVTSSTTRGFTGQEMMDGVCYVNFNARVYDPSLGRFMSADPVTGTVYDLQILNRYSYVGNNPLSLTDPTGLCFLGCFWHSAIFRELFSIAISLVLPEILPGLELELFNTAFSAFTNVGIAGGVAGFITTGKVQGALMGVLQAEANFELGNLIAPLPKGASVTLMADRAVDEFVAHGLVGGLFSEAQSGNFKSGFLAAGFATLAPTPVQGESYAQQFEGTVVAATLGGFGSELGGGKFENGAITGAFVYLFNDLQSHTHVDPFLCGKIGLCEPIPNATPRQAIGQTLAVGSLVASGVFGGGLLVEAFDALFGTGGVAAESDIATAPELSYHATDQAALRNISMDEISNALNNGYSFEYVQNGESLMGYYDPDTNVFVGVGNRITTVIKPANPANYLRNLMGR